jgi:hypothetical protein
MTHRLLAPIALSAALLLTNVAPTMAGDPSQWGMAAATTERSATTYEDESLARKVNEYEGQHLA